MSGVSIGECWEVLVRFTLYGYAVENLLHFESIPGVWDGDAICAEVHNIIMDQWLQNLSSDQELRAVYARRLDIIHPVAVLSASFPYKHGSELFSEVFPQAAACVMFKSHSRARTDWSRKYYGAAVANFFDDGRLSSSARTNIDGLGVWLMTNYGYPQIAGLTLITWSRKIWTATVDRNQAATRVTSITTSDRIAVVHSRRTGAGY